MPAQAKKNWHSIFLKIFQVSTDEEMGNVLVKFFNSKPFSHFCTISAQKAKQVDVTTMFTYSHANMPLGQSEHVYYLSYFIKSYVNFCVY